jgi:hypothetical protein
MSLWGKSSTNEAKPKYLSNSEFGTYRKEDVYASNRGWEYLNPKLNVVGTGTISVSNGAVAVTGASGANFLTETKVGNYLISTTGAIVGRIRSITDATNLVLVSPYTGTSIVTGKYGIKVSGEPELLVAISGGLNDLLAGATITNVRWKTKGTGTIAASATFSVIVDFNEPVAITAGATLNVRNFTDSVNIVATFAQLDSSKTGATFEFTAPVAGKSLGIQTQTITGTIADATGTNGTPDKSISAAVATALTQRTTA